MILFLVNEEHENRTHCLLHFCLENCPSALLRKLSFSFAHLYPSFKPFHSPLIPEAAKVSSSIWQHVSHTPYIILEKKRPYPPPSVIFWIILHTKFAQFSLAINKTKIQFSSVQSLSHVRLFETLWISSRQASLSVTNSQSLPKLMSIKLVTPSSRLILCRPLLLLPSILHSIRVFSNESALRMRWPKYWSFSFKISPTNEHPGLIFFGMDWLDLLAVQGL